MNPKHQSHYVAKAFLERVIREGITAIDDLPFPKSEEDQEFIRKSANSIRKVIVSARQEIESLQAIKNISESSLTLVAE